MTATIERTSTVAAVVATLRVRYHESRQAAQAASEARGIDPFGPAHIPPTDDELIADLWWYSGMLDALDDLTVELEIEDGDV